MKRKYYIEKMKSFLKTKSQKIRYKSKVLLVIFPLVFIVGFITYGSLLLMFVAVTIIIFSEVFHLFLN